MNICRLWNVVNRGRTTAKVRRARSTQEGAAVRKGLGSPDAIFDVALSVDRMRRGKRVERKIE